MLDQEVYGFGTLHLVTFVTMHVLYCMDRKKTDHEMIPGLGTHKRDVRIFEKD